MIFKYYTKMVKIYQVLFVKHSKTILTTVRKCFVRIYAGGDTDRDARKTIQI